MLVQLAATWGWAQCLATPHSTRAPAPSPQREHSRPKRALPAPRPPRPACSVTCGSKHPIKPSCTEGVGGSKKGSYLGQGQAHLPANPGLHPTAVYTHLACGRCGTKGHRALQHLLPPALPGHLLAAAAGSVAQHPALASLGNSLAHTAEGGCSFMAPSQPSQCLLQNVLRELSLWLWGGKASCWCSNISFGSILKTTEGFSLYYAQIAQWAQFLEQVLKWK